MPIRWKFALLYFSEGAPIGFLWWALPTLLREDGVAVARITGLTAALALPWTLKFLWAPLVDAWRGPRWGFRHWVTTAQLGMGFTLLPLVWIDPATQFPWWFVLLLSHAVCAATQDVGIDALAVNAVDAADRGRLNAAMQIGMLGGRSLFGGGAILLVGWGGWPWLFGALVGAVWLSLVVLWWGGTEPSSEEGRREAATSRDFLPMLRTVFTRRTTWLGLGFALTAGAGFEAAGGLAGPMLVDAGADSSHTGFFFALPVVVAMAVGGWIGGAWSDGGDRIKRAVIALLLMSVTLLGLAGGLGLGWSSVGLMAALTLVYLGIGAFTAISYAIFMDLTDRRLGATQFSTFMAATNGCEVWAVASVGPLVGHFGYAPGIALMAAAGLLGLVFLRALARSMPNA